MNTPNTLEGDLVAAMDRESLLLETARQILEKKDLQKEDNLSWSTYHASKQDESTHYTEPAISRRCERIFFVQGRKQIRIVYFPLWECGRHQRDSW